MKKVLILLVLAAAAWFGWQAFQSPTIDGRTIPPEDRVDYISPDVARFDITDRLDEGVWTVVLFHAGTVRESRELLREIEIAVRTKHESVRLVVVPLHGGVDAPVAKQHGITEIPTVWIYDGYGKKSSSESFLRRAILRDRED